MNNATVIKPRQYQLDAVNSIFNYWSNNGNKGNPCIVMPVGSGKSLTMAHFVKTCFDKFGSKMSKILIMTHVKELIEQDYQAVIDYWNGADIGIYSASLKSKNIKNKIVCCGVQSVANSYADFGKVNCLVIDECHLVPVKQETTYRKVIAGLKAINPKLKVIGFTGTPFRLDCGVITENGIFDDIVYNMCTVDKFEWLIENKFLCDAVPKRPDFQIDVSGIKTRGGEYIEKELQNAVDKEEVTRLALTESIKLAEDRKHWLIFCTGVEHANHVSDFLNEHDVPCTVISGDLDMKTRQERIADFKAGKYRAVANVNVLSTGFNFPDIDCLIMLRPTQSVSLYIQACGRGIRYSPNKENCLVLDFAGNVARLGCINDPVPMRKKKEKHDGECGQAPVKVCPKCHTYVSASATVCPCCAYEFPKTTQLTAHASLRAIIKKKNEEAEKMFDISKISYTKIQTKNGVQLLVTYFSGVQAVGKDWINLESEKSFSANIAKTWINYRNKTDYFPKDTQELLVMCLQGKMKEPKRIAVKTVNGYNRITRYDFEDKEL